MSISASTARVSPGVNVVLPTPRFSAYYAATGAFVAVFSGVPREPQEQDRARNTDQDDCADGDERFHALYVGAGIQSDNLNKVFPIYYNDLSDDPDAYIALHLTENTSAGGKKVLRPC